MSVCRRYGISHSYFLGGSRRWTQEDRDKAIAYERHLLERCPNCGTFYEDWRDPETKKWLEEPRYQPVAKRCPGCEVLGEARDEIPEHDRSSAYITFERFKDEDEEDED